MWRPSTSAALAADLRQSGPAGFTSRRAGWLALTGSEAKVFVDHGMSPERTISALTRVNARILGKANQLGTIETGKLADIIVVKGNPLFDMSASLSSVNVVIKDGVIYKGGH